MRFLSGNRTRGHFPVLFIVILSVSLWRTTKGINVTVEFPSLPSKVARKCYVPDTIDVTLRTPNETISLNLTRSKDVGENVPVFVMRTRHGGKASLIKHKPLGQKKELLYQDQDQGAEFEVTCIRDAENPLSLDGTLELHEWKLYSLKRSNVSNFYTLTEETLPQSFVEAAGLDIDNNEPIKSGTTSEKATSDITKDVFIDVLALIEHSVYKRWYNRSTEVTDEQKNTDTIENIRRHFTHMFNAVNLRYKSASPHIHMKLAVLMIEDTASGYWFQSVWDTEPDKTYIDAKKLLDTQYDLSKTPDFPKHDHFASFTSVDIYWNVNGAPSYSLGGLAMTSQICVQYGKSVSILEYQDHFIEDVRLTAHEIGHCLGAYHDGAYGNTCSSTDNYIMTATASSYTSTNPFIFSPCSRNYFIAYINRRLSSGSTYSTSCLLESLEADSIPVVTDEDLPGQLLSQDEQCQLVYGSGSFVCRSFGVTSSTICLQSRCYNPTNNKCYLRYADRGSSCGDSMWCEEGKCVFSNNAAPADPNCILGDQPVVSSDQTCQERITSNSTCERDYIIKRCCERCKEVKCNRQCQNNGFINNATCQCVCPNCYTGQLCETPSALKVCQNGGTLNKAHCECVCTADWTGDNCETSSCNKVCGNGGTLDTTACQCKCEPSWTGDTCDISTLNETSSCNKVCGNGGTLNTTACQCKCEPSWTGDTCNISTLNGTFDMTTLAIGLGVGLGVVFLISLHVFLIMYYCKRSNMGQPMPS